jgi:hypothetical protein
MAISTLRVYRDVQADLWIEVLPGQFLVLDRPSIDAILDVGGTTSEADMGKDYGPMSFVTLLGESAEKKP